MHRLSASRQLLVAIGLVAAAGTGPATAAGIYSNLGSGGSYQSGAGYLLGNYSSLNQAVAAPFVAAQSADFVSATLALGSLGGTTANVFLAADNSGSAGSILESLVQQASIVGGSGSLITFDCSVCNVSLAGGTQYWIVATVGNGNTQWFFNDTGGQGSEYNYSGSSTGPWSATSTTTPAFEVDGNVASNPVPEPSTLFIAMSGLAMVGLQRRRRSS